MALEIAAAQSPCFIATSIPKPNQPVLLLLKLNISWKNSKTVIDYICIITDGYTTKLQL